MPRHFHIAAVPTSTYDTYEKNAAKTSSQYYFGLIIVLLHNCIITLLLPLHISCNVVFFTSKTSVLDFKI